MEYNSMESKFIDGLSIFFDLLVEGLVVDILGIIYILFFTGAIVCITFFHKVDESEKLASLLLSILNSKKDD